MFDNFTKTILEKFDESNKLRNAQLAIESNEIRSTLDLNQSRVENSVVESLSSIKCYINEMKDDFRNKSDIEFKSFDMKTNGLDEKVTNIESKLNQVIEVLAKLDVTISQIKK